MSTSLRIAHTGAQPDHARLRVRVLKPGVHPPEDLSLTAEHVIAVGEALAVSITPGAVIVIDEPLDFAAALRHYRDSTPPYTPPPELKAAAEQE